MQYKSYAFDLDDNLLTLPTKITLKTPTSKIKKFSTLEFEKIRPNLKQKKLSITPTSFKDFHSDTQFLKDIRSSKKAGSWQNLVNCIVKHTSIFAIITARGHSPEAIREGLKLIIIRNLSKSHLEKFYKKFSELYKIQTKSPEEALDVYLNLCKFYPVSNSVVKKSLGSTNTEELKSLAFEDFQVYVKEYVKNKLGEETKVTIGFSDDSIFHLKKLVNDSLKKHGLFFYQTTAEGENNFI